MGTDQIKLIHTYAYNRLMTFGPPIGPDGLATLWYSGRRLDEFIVLEKWRECSRFPSLFGCLFCKEPVIMYRSPEPLNPVVQNCRCSLIQFAFSPPFQTAEQWA
jgi:hypothetical protein